MTQPTASELADTLDAFLEAPLLGFPTAATNEVLVEWVREKGPEILSSLRQVEVMRGAGWFLLDRLAEFEQTMEAESGDAAVRDWHGYVVPAIARLRALTGEAR